MCSTVLPNTDDMTPVKDNNEKVILIVFGVAVYDRLIIQYESMWNSCHLIPNRI